MRRAVWSRTTRKGEGIDEPLAMQRGATTDYYEADGLGSITSLTRIQRHGRPKLYLRLVRQRHGSTGSLTNFFRYTAREFDTETNLYYYRARYYDPSAGRFLSEDPLRFDAGPDFYRYVGNDPIGAIDPYGLDGCRKSCGIKKGPEYNVSGSVSGGTAFFWSATFLDDATHDPKCCEARQLISWNNIPGGGVPHQGFPPTDQPYQWYEDRDQNDKRYGRRTGPHSDLQPGDSYDGDNYSGGDRPQGFPPGVTLRFRLIVVDVCNGHKTIYTSKTINVNF